MRLRKRKTPLTELWPERENIKTYKTSKPKEIKTKANVVNREKNK